MQRGSLDISMFEGRGVGINDLQHEAKGRHGAQVFVRNINQV